MSSTLIENFKFSVKLSCIGGIYIPGAENLFRFKKLAENFFKINFYICVAYINFQVGQVVYNAVYNDEVPMALKAYFSVGMITIETTALRLMAIQWKKNDLKEMIKLWDESFKGSLYPAYKEEELQIIRKRIEKIARYQIIWFIVPMIVWPLTPIVTGRELLNNAFPGDHDSSPVFELLFFYHLFLAYYLATGWVAFDTFFFLIMGTILVELGYLKRSLKEIFSTLQMNHSGEIFFKNEEIRKIYADSGMAEFSHRNRAANRSEAEFHHQNFALYGENIRRVRKLLEIWIAHYSELINYSDAVSKFYAPILIGQFFYLAAYGCATLYMAFVVDLELQNILASVVFYGNGYFMTCIMCSYGNQIYEESSTLTEEVFGQDWVLYPKDIRHSLHMIITVTTKRPIQIHAFHFLKLNMKAFEKLLQLTYSFVAFMTNVRGKFRI